jgi:hypothetical protein
VRPRRLPAALAVVALLAAVAVAALAMPSLASAGAPRLDIGIQDPLEEAFHEQDPSGAYDAIDRAGIHVVRVPVPWAVAASKRPADPSDPTDPAYFWGSIDGRLDRIWSHGMEPMLVLYAPPAWAQAKRSDGSRRLTADASDFAAFAKAAATRYSGAPGRRPRVRLWQLWNEPNLKMFLDDTPQHYREMANAAYASIHGVAADNVVAAGGLAPFSDPKDEFGIAPMRFMREMLCMTSGSHPHATCSAKSSFDAWSNHPYTSGGPSHRASLRDEVSLGNLPQVRRVLSAAARAGHVRSRGRVRFWITEFSWDTKGPDPGGVPLARHARWVAEALYRMWRLDVSLVVWFQLRDNPVEGGNWAGTFQAGLYFNTTKSYADEKAKPFARVLRFPFVALPASHGRATVWGRTPDGRRHPVTVERRSGARWRTVRRVTASSTGIFRATPRVRRGTVMRARIGSDASVPFKDARTADVRVNAFGGELQH